VTDVIVCSCRAVNDSVVRGAILSGADCADEVAERCGAGSDCGSCLATVERMLAQFDAAASRSEAAA
jgi:bacterioferritin-associated ferredoxin